MVTTTTIPTAVELAEQLDDLHQLIYTRGGIRPTNAAVEELTKLLLLQLAVDRYGEVQVDGLGSLRSVLSASRLSEPDGADAAKAAFRVANTLEGLAVRLSDGTTQPVWPIDEPLRISRSDVLAAAMEILQSVAPRGQSGQAAIDPVGAAFDVFLRGRYENAGGLGTYLTPENVVDLMVTLGFDLVDAESGPSSPAAGLFGDPCCGSGRFLLGMLYEARRREGSFTRLSEEGRLFGADQSASAVAMARVNLLAAGVDLPEVFVVEDSITDVGIDGREGQFSLILTNPPFGDGKYDSTDGITRTSDVLPGLQAKIRIDPSLAFVARCIELLEPGGVAGIILPDGVGDGPHMRELLLHSQVGKSKVELEGVISLPPSTFAPAGTTAKTSITFLRRGGHRNNSQVFFSNAKHVGFLMKNAARVSDPNGDDLPGIAECVSRFISSDSTDSDHSDSSFPHIDSLRSLDASVVSLEADEARNLLRSLGGKEARELLKYVGRRRQALSETVPFISVLHVDKFGTIDWRAASAYRPVTSGQLAEPGDLIVSLLNPSKFRAAVVPFDCEKAHCSSEFGVFHSTISPHATLALLNHPSVRKQLAPLGRGTSSSRRRIQAEDVLSVILPDFEPDCVEQVASEVERATEAIGNARHSLGQIYDGTGAGSTETTDH